MKNTENQIIKVTAKIMNLFNFAYALVSTLRISLLIIILLMSLKSVNSHLVGDKTYLSEMKKVCEHAYICFHDTIMICGKSVNEARTFLDLCDMYEYACEYNMIFRHVKEEDGVCPNPRDLFG